MPIMAAIFPFFIESFHSFAVDTSSKVCEQSTSAPLRHAKGTEANIRMFLNQQPRDINLFNSVPRSPCRSSKVPICTPPLSLPSAKTPPHHISDTRTIIFRVPSVLGTHDIRAPEKSSDSTLTEPRDINMPSRGLVEVHLPHLVEEVCSCEDRQVWGCTMSSRNKCHKKGLRTNVSVYERVTLEKRGGPTKRVRREWVELIGDPADRT